ncbi:hypothetical protein ROJ8625_03003 [Roseivivax jejudonensis]|uniref:Glycosyl transferase family 2 n=1 Tax=Roseivivax jejudonensis TaxID=1529041 RepID=A0A1X6ZTV6_9RHOB|nr:glycosyltransferase family 2 protein [Roseivivax jejudonensis]SLN59446.1 hypothetical protein ROJ8625_03003 [Roseivivax jejudonensis]
MPPEFGAPGPTWGVVSTQAESPAVTAAFAAWHAALGAARIHIYLDAPDDETMTLLAQIPACSVVACDRGYWRGVQSGKRPRGQERRQVLNADHAYAQESVDWLLHLDADEYLWPERPVPEVLDGASVDALKIANVERAFRAGVPQRTIFDGVFRAQVPPERSDILDPDIARLTSGGLSGHVSGKAFAPKGRQGLLMGIHAPRLGRAANRRIRRDYADGLRILHFDGLTRKHWIAKTARYIAREEKGPTRHQLPWRATLAEELSAEPDLEAALAGAHDRLKTVRPDEEARLAAEGYILDLSFDPAPALAAYGLAASVDLSAATHDRWMEEAGAGLATKAKPAR